VSEQQPDQIDMMDADKLRTELRAVINKNAALEQQRGELVEALKAAGSKIPCRGQLDMTDMIRFDLKK